MNVINVIDICRKILDLDIEGEMLNSADGLKENDAAVKLLVCCNFVNEELYRDYASDCRKTVVEAKDGKVDVSGLKLCRVISLMDADGNFVPFRYGENAITVDNDGRYNLSYAKLPKELDFEDELTLPSPRITERILIYGVIAEYLYQQGDWQKAASWKEKYKDALAVAVTKTTSMRLPVGRWL